MVRPFVQVSVPAAGFVPIASVTVVAGTLVAVVPAAFWIATMGWIGNATSFVDVPGCDVKVSLLGST